MKQNGTKRGVALYSYSGEFGISMNLEDCFKDMYDMDAHGLEILANTHKDIIDILPYVYCCHAKFNYMDENFEEKTIPYSDILTVMEEHGYNGYVLSEYEGPHKDETGYVSEQLKRQHIMMRRILKEEV